MRPPPPWPASTMRPSWTSIQASRRLANRKRSCACNSSKSPSTSGGGGSKWATRSPNDRRLNPSTAPCGIHDSEVTEDSIRMPALLSSPTIRPSADANRPKQVHNPIGQPGLPHSRLVDGKELPAAVDPLQGMLSTILHRDVGAEDEVPNSS